MSFPYDGTGVTTGNFTLIPNGWYPFQIFDAEEGTSRGGHKQVLVKAACLDGRYKDQTVWHWITFLPKENKGAGMALHFLKSIEQAHDGQIVVEPGAWKGKRFMGKVYSDTYNGKTNNKFDAISPYRDDAIPLEEPEPVGAAIDSSDIPF